MLVMINITKMVRNGLICVFAVFVIFYCGNVVTLGEKLGAFCGLFLPNFIASFIEVLFDVFLILGLPAFAWYYLWKSTQSCKSINIEDLHLNDDKCVGDDVKKARCKLAAYLVARHTNRRPDDHFLNLDEFNGFHNGKTLAEDLDNVDLDETLKIYLREARRTSKAEGLKIASLAAVNTVLCPNSAGDGISMMIWSVRLVATITQIYGLRPKVRNLISLYLHVLFGSFLAGSIDELTDNLKEIPILNKIPLLGEVGQAAFAYYRIMLTCEQTILFLEEGFSNVNEVKAKAKMAALEDIKSGEGLKIFNSIFQNKYRQFAGFINDKSDKIGEWIKEHINLSFGFK